VTALSGLLVIMFKARVSHSIYARNVAVLMIAMAYSFYAIYASGKDAVFGAFIVLAIGYLVYGFIAKGFVNALPASSPGSGQA